MKSNKPLFKSIFSKYFATTAVLIVLSFMLTAVMQLFFARRYWLSDKRSLLEEQVQNVAGMIQENAVEYYPDSYYISESVRPLLVRLAAAADTNVLITDNQYRVVLCSHTDCEHDGVVLPQAVQDALQQEQFFMVSRKDTLYNESQYMAGKALTVNGVSVMGYVVVSSSASELSEYVWENLQTYLLSTVAVLTIAFVALYIITYHTVRPLRQMAAITRQFSNGDFSGRAKVRGNDEIAELAHALNGMAVSLSSLEDMRRSFVANVSHELKTPMTTIAGFIDGILDGTVPPERRGDYLRIVSEETKRLSRLVTAMLNLSRIDSDQLKLNPVSFDLTAAVCATLLSFEQRIEKKNIAIEGIDQCEPISVYGDYDLLQQVVYNLLDNAVKFTEDGGTIRITLAHAEGKIVCVVRNTGSGIPASEMPHIFERFYKSDRSRGLDKTGTGLGLYIVQTVIGLHGGEITVRSVEGEYCEFVFWLPDKTP